LARAAYPYNKSVAVLSVVFRTCPLGDNLIVVISELEERKV
jgi:hypothetical protein